MKKGLKKALCLFAVVMMFGCMAIPCFAADNDASAAVSAVSSALSEVTGVLTIGNIVSILAIVLAIAIGFFFFWWGVRKVIRIAKNAFSKGNVSV